LIKGFTTNPTLMRMAGVEDYETFAREVLDVITDRPVSFEVFADDKEGMLLQGRAIATWGDNVNVKIPYTNTKGEPMLSVIQELSDAGVQVNVTAMMTAEQVEKTAAVLNPDVGAIVSVFAGRVADTGLDPMPLMRRAAANLKDRPKAELLWASPRELLNIFHADETGCHIITVTNDVLAKLAGVGKDLDEFSLDTVKMFYNDATSAGYTIRTD
jgi:transaldolase